MLPLLQTAQKVSLQEADSRPRCAPLVPGGAVRANSHLVVFDITEPTKEPRAIPNSTDMHAEPPCPICTGLHQHYTLYSYHLH